jgi:two-component system response regulator FixJ
LHRSSAATIQGHALPVSTGNSEYRCGAGHVRFSPLDLATEKFSGKQLQPHSANAVYVLEPDDGIRDGIRSLLDSFDVEVRTYPDGASFLQHDARSAQGCALIESQLPDLSGLALLGRLRAMGNTIPVVLLTSSRDDGLEQQAVEQGVAGVIHKPMVSERLLEQLASLLPQPPPGLSTFRS